MSAWTCRRQGRPKDCSTRLRTPCWKGLSAESEEKREPASDIDTATLDSLKALDPNRPIREADIRTSSALRTALLQKPQCDEAQYRDEVKRNRSRAQGDRSEF